MGGASQPSTEPQIKRRGWGHTELHLTHFGRLATTGITCSYFTCFFCCFFSPDEGETSAIRCLIFPSLCHKCTVCVHLPSLPSWVGSFFFFKHQTLLRLGWKPDVLIAAHRRAEWLSVLCWLVRKS